MNSKKVAILIGSLRKESFSRKLAKALVEVAPESLTCEIVEIGDLPLYNEDLDSENPPTSWVTLRKKLRSSDGIIFVTPEYNRSVPAVLKNAIDVASRPYGHNVLNGKPGAVVSVSPGSAGGFGANHHLRQSLVFLNVPTMQQPEAYIGDAAHLFNKEGQVAKESSKEFLVMFMNAFGAWVAKNTLILD